MKWHNMVPVNDVYLHGRYEQKLVEQFVCGFQDDILVTQDARVASPMNSTHYIGVTHMDQT